MNTRVIKSLANTVVTLHNNKREGISMSAVTRIKDRCDMGRCQFIFSTGSMEMCDRLVCMSIDRATIVCNKINGNRINVR